MSEPQDKSWAHLDRQLLSWETALIREFGLPSDRVNALATLVGNEIRAEAPAIKRILESEKYPITLNDLYDEIISFEKSKIGSHDDKLPPFLMRRLLVYQNYLFFVYLRENCFETLKTVMVVSTTRKICLYLLSEKVRNFRNALAHGWWKYDFDAKQPLMHFWNRRDKQAPFEHYSVGQDELNFWLALSKTIAYTMLEELLKV